jgi:hypothetical protein
VNVTVKLMVKISTTPWSAPLVCISVDNKHVRLTPALQSSNLMQSKHGSTFADARLTIDYVARWSFYA